jgi:peptide deformylase
MTSFAIVDTIPPMAKDLHLNALRLRIEQAGAPVLHQGARPVSTAELQSADLQRLIDAMFATLAGVGVGLAAPQIGVGLQLVVIEDSAELQAAVAPELLREQDRVPIAPHVLINPTLIVVDPTPAEFFEGCLSVDGYRAIVPRARRVRLLAEDRTGTPFEREATGWYARILQHEIDHLAGRLYVARMLPCTFVSAASLTQHWSNLSIDETKRLLGRPLPLALGEGGA